jgi:probable HAF family extracellular repeat protein
MWSKEKGIDCAPTGLNGCMRDLGTLDGDFNSGALYINDKGQVVGVSNDANGEGRAFLWQNGMKMTDLNTLVVGDSPFKNLILAAGIDSRGEIAGFGLTNSFEVHAFLATPAGTTASAGPKNSTVIARQIMLDGTASFSVDDQPLTYQWSIPHGSPQAAILHGNTANPEVQFASGRNLYTFQLTVTDSTGTSVSDLVTVNFQGN